MQAGEKSHLSAHACILWSARFLFSLTAVYFCLPTKRKKNNNKQNKQKTKTLELQLEIGEGGNPCKTKRITCKHTLMIIVSDQTKFSKEWLGIPVFNSLAKSSRAAVSLSPGIQWMKLLDFPDIEIGELSAWGGCGDFRGEIFPVCCWYTLCMLKVFFIPTFFSTPSSQISSLL